MGSLSWVEIGIIALIALMVVGPKGLPKLARTVGKVVRDFKREARELKDAVNFELEEVERKERASTAKAKSSNSPYEYKELDTKKDPYDEIFETDKKTDEAGEDKGAGEAERKPSDKTETK